MATQRPHRAVTVVEAAAGACEELGNLHHALAEREAAVEVAITQVDETGDELAKVAIGSP